MRGIQKKDNTYNFPKLFVSLQPIYTEIKPNKMAEESNNELSMPFPDEWRKAISDYDGE